MKIGTRLVERYQLQQFSTREIKITEDMKIFCDLQRGNARFEPSRSMKIKNKIKRRI